MNTPRLLAVCSILVLGEVLGFAIVEAGPGYRIERHPLRVNTIPLAGAPSVAADIDGDFVVVWSAFDGIWGRRFGRDGAPRGEQFLVSPPPHGPPAVAMDSDGDFVVVWRVFSLDLPRAAFARRFSRDGIAQGDVFTVNSPSYEPGGGLIRIAMDADGDFVVVSNGTDISLGITGGFGRRFSAMGVPQGAEFLVQQDRANAFGIFFDVAMDASGDFVVVWEQVLLDGPNAIQGKRFNADGIAQGDVFTASASGPGSAHTPAAAMDATGNFVVAFHRVNFGVSAGVFARRHNALGVSQGAEFRVSRFGRLPSRRHISADMDTDGDFVVAWISDPEGVDAFLNTRLFRASGVPATDDRQFGFREAGLFPDEVAVSMDGRGSFITAWQQFVEQPDPDERGPNVFVQRYAGPDDTRPACSQFIASQAGTGGNDLIRGAAGDDVIQGLSGSDVISGRGGDDVICGGSGNDQLFGEAGEDQLLGGAGDDVLDGGDQRDFCDGQKHVTADTAVSCESIKNVP
jgi:hypothetical protein